jgi:hypothetical protein
MKMDAEGYSEASESFYQTIWRRFQTDSSILTEVYIECQQDIFMQGGGFEKWDELWYEPQNIWTGYSIRRLQASLLFS